MARSNLRQLSPGQLMVAPSLLSADYAALGKVLSECAAGGGEVLHLDVMDGHFVPNLALGTGLVASLRPHSELPFDVHLMVTTPSQFITPFAQAGADHLTIHVEIQEDVRAVLGQIHAHGLSAGLCLKPGTPAAAVAPFLDLVDLVLVMTVEPGFGGQSFRHDVLAKLPALRALMARTGRPMHLEVDGGVGPGTAAACAAAGCNLLVAGSSVMSAPGGIAAGIAAVRGAAQVAWDERGR